MTTGEHTAIIGAGLAGLTCARALTDAGKTVSIFDKGRGLGGRMASRRADGWRFDHGAVALQPQSPEFTAFLKGVEAEGHAARWDAAGGFAGLPGMSGIVKPMANGLNIISTQRVLGITKSKGGWTLEGPEGAQGTVFDRVILAVPQPQAVELLAPATDIAAQIQQATMSPCWTVMAGFQTRLETEVAFSNIPSGLIDVVSRDTTKPDRSLAGDGWVIQATADWTLAHLDRDPSDITQLMVAAFFQKVGCAPRVPEIAMAHRWLYARTSNPLGQSHIWDANHQVGVCGDWCIGATAEAAYQSGAMLAQDILGR